jgi:hypothetical protein
MRREGVVRGKPTNKRRLTRRHRRFGNHRRRDPGEIAFAGDFILQPPRTRIRGRLDEERWRSSVELAEEGAVQLDIGDVTVNSVIGAAFAKLRGGDGDELENAAAMACTTFGFGGGAPTQAGDATDIVAIELALQRQLGIFENAVEGSSFSEYATQGWSTLSEESWSDVELAEETSPEDDWSIVDVDEDELGT